MQWQRGMMMVALVAGLVLSGCGDDEQGGGREVPTPLTVVAKAGTLTFVLDSGVNFFKTQVIGGVSNGSTPGTQPSGFRPVNWDGTAGGDLNSDAFPNDAFFARGLTMQTDGTGFRVDDQQFVSKSDVDSSNFHPFSGTKLFAVLGSTRMDAVFNVPGQATPAAVEAFGVVFVDNEFATSASIEAFDVHGTSLGVFFAPATASGEFSFVGFRFPSPIVARVRITSGGVVIGTAVDLATNAAAADLVVMDDFVFSEPHSTF